MVKNDEKWEKNLSFFGRSVVACSVLGRIFFFFKYDNKKECKFKMTIKSVSLCIGKYMDGLVFNVVTMH